MAAKNHNDFLERFRGKANHIGVKGLRELLTGPTEKIELLKQDNSQANYVIRHVANKVQSQPDPMAEHLKKFQSAEQSVELPSIKSRTKSKELLPIIHGQNKNSLPYKQDAIIKRYNSEFHKPTKSILSNADLLGRGKFEAFDKKYNQALNKVRYPTADQPTFINGSPGLRRRKLSEANLGDLRRLNMFQMQLNQRTSENVIRYVQKLKSRDLQDKKRTRLSQP